MDVTVSQGDIAAFEADTIIVNLFAGVTAPSGATGAVDKAVGGAISELIAAGDLRGKAKEVAVLYPRGAIPARRVLVAGLGDRETFDLHGVRVAAAAAIQRARELNARRVATIVHGAGVAGLPAAAAVQATVEGSLLADYRYTAFKSEKEEGGIEQLAVVEFDAGKLPDIEAGAAAGTAVAAGVALARDLVLAPPNVATPVHLAETARRLAETYGLAVTVGDRAWAAERNMGAFLAVAKGAGDEPQFIILEHNADQVDLPAVVLVGKGITFDSGGVSLKSPENMMEMKADMGGAAAVLGAMKVIGELQLPLRVIGITPCTENKPDANAYRPADIITASNGKTIEIVSTDAEGRMILADALVYAGRYQPAAVIDLATLTGSCVIALGDGVAAGLFSNDDGLRDRLVQAGQTTHERVWPLPLWDDYKAMIKSDVADMQNSGGRYGGVGSSAIFLSEFVSYPWAHLDIAGMAFTKKPQNYEPKGGTGYGVRLLVELLRQWPAS